MYEFNNGYVDTMPCDPQAEVALLCSCLSNKQALTLVADMIKPNDFYLPNHRYLWVAIKRLFDRDDAVDMVSLTSELQSTQTLDEAGGFMGVSSVYGVPCDPAAVETYAGTLRRLANYRGLIEAGQRITQLGFEGSDTAVEDAQRILADTIYVGSTGSATSVADDIDEALARLEESMKGGLLGVTTGISDLDKLTRGLQKTDLLLLAARPSMGKTALALNIAVAAAKARTPVLFCSVEMSKLKVTQRILMMVAGGTKQVREAKDKVAKLPIFIDDKSCTMTAIRSTARRLHSQGKLGLVIVDYVQMISSEGSLGRASKNEQVSEISKSLKRLAIDLDVPVLALSQFSRAPEARRGNKPKMSDLRDSGSLEQDADIIMLMYRADYYKDDNEEPDNTCDIIVDKNRNGEVGVVNTIFRAEQQRFYGVAK